MTLSELIPPQLSYRLVIALLTAVSILTLTGLFGRHVYAELATHFRLQYALASLACIVLLTVFHSWRLLPLAVATLIFNLIFILPYYFAAPLRRDQSSAVHLRLMQANVLGSNKNYGALIEAVHEAQPDIIVLQEFTEEWLEQTRGLISEYPYYKAVPKPGGAGMAIFSRYPLEEVAVLNLDASAHLALLAKANVRGTPVSILALHPPTPVRTDKFLNRNRQFTEAASLLRVIKGSRLLIGDLNTTMWSPYFTDLTRGSGLRDARLGFGLQPSWPMPLPAFLQLPIDHCLVSDEVSVEGIRTGARTGSDHRPLIVDLDCNE
jgi:endonuclease/exonuclease/phosphatase (EEP) superfamily protein YafD